MASSVEVTLRGQWYRPRTDGSDVDHILWVFSDRGRHEYCIELVKLTGLDKRTKRSIDRGGRFEVTVRVMSQPFLGEPGIRKRAVLRAKTQLRWLVQDWMCRKAQLTFDEPDLFRDVKRVW